MSLTIRERLRKALEDRGWKLDSATGYYWVMVHPERNFKWFLGRAGALRKGRVVKTSRSATDSPFYKALLVSAAPTAPALAQATLDLDGLS